MADQDELTALLYRCDPMGLVPCGVPQDEYSGEAELLLHHLQKGGPHVLLSDVIAWITAVLSGQFWPTSLPAVTTIETTASAVLAWWYGRLESPP